MDSNAHNASPQLLFRLLHVQGVVTPITLVSCTVILLAPVYNWLLIYRFRFGLDGAALAMDASQATNLALLAGYSAFYHRRLAGSERQTWRGWSLEALRGWGGFLRLALPSTVMVCLEW